MEITALFEPETGIQAEEYESWQVYPNPVKNSLSIKRSAEQSNPVVITVKTLCDTQLFKTKTDQHNFIIPFSFEEISSGIYLLVIETRDYREVFKIIKP